jgi:hypothetical protein
LNSLIIFIKCENIFFCFKLKSSQAKESKEQMVIMFAHENKITTLNNTIVGLTDVIKKYEVMENKFKEVQQNYSKLEVKISHSIYNIYQPRWKRKRVV